MIPLQIGARDVAFPRLNALSFWIFLAGGLFLNSSWIFGGGADGGWFNYAPNSGLPFSPGHGIDFYALGLQITGFASLLGAINLIVTIINLRSPGMSLFRMPVFTWMMLVVQFLLVFAMPVISIALFLLTFDRLFGANFFNTAAGADPLLWQHLFWIFGHPEVYILVLPAFGIVSEIIPVFARKPIFGYHFMVFSGIAIGFIGWGVWAHHMFVSGIGPVAVTAFSMSTMIIAVPTGVKILNWLATLWGGKLRFTTPMLYASSVVAMFTVGGLSGVTHAMVAADTQQTDTYYIVAHFHYVIFGGIILGLFGGMFFWWPKVFGFMLSERGGKITFWTMITGMNLTFGPMHILGLEGMSRRIDTYSKGFGFEFWNFVVSIGAFIIATSVLTFLINVVVSTVKYKRAKADGTYVNPGPDPWDARSLEWMIPSPAPEHNFDEDIEVHGLDEFWHRKYGFDENHRVVRIATAEQVAQKGDATNVHLPSPSYWPIVIAARPADHRLRPHLQPVAVCARRPPHRRRHLRVRARAARRSRCPSSSRRSWRRARGRAHERDRGGEPWLRRPRSRRRPRRQPPTALTARARGCRTTRSPCGCSSRPTACCSALISTYLLYHDRISQLQLGPKAGLRHPVHVGQLVRAADELAHDGAGAVGAAAR